MSIASIGSISLPPGKPPAADGSLTKSFEYLSKSVGVPLTQCLAELVAKCPSTDPIEWIAHWLYRHMDAELYFFEKSKYLKDLHRLNLELERENALRQKDRDRLGLAIRDLKVQSGEDIRSMSQIMRDDMKRLLTVGQVRLSVFDVDFTMLGDMDWLRSNGLDLLRALGVSLSFLESMTPEEREAYLAAMIERQREKELQRQADKLRKEELKREAEMRIADQERMKTLMGDPSKLQDMDYLAEHPSLMRLLGIDPDKLASMSAEERERYLTGAFSNKQAEMAGGGKSRRESTLVALWTLDCHLGLVCEHSLLGLMRATPPFIPPETPEYWEAREYKNQSLYDHEIYSTGTPYTNQSKYKDFPSFGYRDLVDDGQPCGGNAPKSVGAAATTTRGKTVNDNLSVTKSNEDANGFKAALSSVTRDSLGDGGSFDWDDDV